MKPHRYSLALRRVAPILAQHMYGYDLLRTLAYYERLLDRDPDGWNTAESVYWLGVWWHGGQACPLYEALCATEYNPGPCQNRPEKHSAASMILADLIRIVRPRKG